MSNRPNAISLKAEAEVLSLKNIFIVANSIDPDLYRLLNYTFISY